MRTKCNGTTCTCPISFNFHASSLVSCAIYIKYKLSHSLSQAQEHAHAFFGFLNHIKFSLLKVVPFLGSLLFPYFLKIVTQQDFYNRRQSIFGNKTVPHPFTFTTG